MTRPFSLNPRLAAPVPRGRAMASTFAAITLLTSSAAWAFPNYSIGHISDVTLVRGDVFISLDVALPSNCAGATTSWLRISGDNKPMIAFVIGLWMRGDLTGPRVTVYTDGVETSGMCAIGQLDPD